MKKRLFLAWILPAFAIMFAPAQQSSELLKTTSLTPSALPAPHSMTAFNPYWSLGRGFWKGGNLIFLEPRQPRVDLYDKDSIRSSIKVKFPGNADVRLYDAIVTKNGRLIVSGCYKPDISDWHCFIGFPNAEGRVSQIVDTKELEPRTISTCDDGATVWAFGRSRHSWNDAKRVHDPYDALRQYDMTDGRLKTSMLSTSTFSQGPDAGEMSAPHQIMQCHDKTLGLYAGSSDEWIEYDTFSNKLSRWKLPRVDHHWALRDGKGDWLPQPDDSMTGLAMLDSGEVYASFSRADHENERVKHSVGLFRMLKGGNNQGTWILVGGTQAAAGEKSAFHELCGTDGKSLVYSRFGERGWFFSSAPD